MPRHNRSFSDSSEQQTGRLPGAHEEFARLSIPTIRQYQIRLRCSRYMHEQGTYDLCCPRFRLLPWQTAWNPGRRE